MEVLLSLSPVDNSQAYQEAFNLFEIDYYLWQVVDQNNETLKCDNNCGYFVLIDMLKFQQFQQPHHHNQKIRVTDEYASLDE